jgi:hypothetical protein
MTLKRMDNVLIVVDDLEAAPDQRPFDCRLALEHHREGGPDILDYIRGPEGIIVALAEQLG